MVGCFFVVFVFVLLGFLGEISTIVVPNCYNYSKNCALLVGVLEVTLRIKPTSCAS